MRRIHLIRLIRRIRTSTWILTAIFLVALAAWLEVRPTSTSSPGTGTSYTLTPATSAPATRPASPVPTTTSSTPHATKTPPATKTPSPSASATVSPSALVSPTPTVSGPASP